MATPTTLNDYYGSQGQALPSVSTRAATYASAGLGDAGSYTGTAAQNTALLGHLTGTPTTPPATPTATSTTSPSSTGLTSTPSASPYDSVLGNIGPNLSDYYQKQLTTLGVPDLQKTVQTFKDQTAQVQGNLDNLTEDINARTRGSLTSQAQADRMNTVEGGVLRNQLSKLGTAAQPATDALSAALNTANTATGFYGQDQKNQLTVLMDKIQRGEKLTDEEWQQASTLAQMAKQHEYTLSEDASKSDASDLNIADILNQYQTKFGGGTSSQPIQVTPQNQASYLSSLFSTPGSGTGLTVQP